MKIVFLRTGQIRGDGCAVKLAVPAKDLFFSNNSLLYWLRQEAHACELFYKFEQSNAHIRLSETDKQSVRIRTIVFRPYVPMWKNNKLFALSPPPVSVL